MPRWPSLLCYMGTWAIYCWLPRTSSHFLYCTRVVSTVSFLSTFLMLLGDCGITFRCWAPSGQLDNDENVYEWCSRAHTDFVCMNCEMGVLYDNYGIVGDIIVRKLCFYIFSIFPNYNLSLSQMNFHMLMYTRLLCLIYSIKSSKGPSRII
jgi:hypothetical protein